MSDPCYICGEPADVWDHAHEDDTTTVWGAPDGHIRGRLCHACNHLAQHPDRLRAALAYVEAHILPTAPLYSAVVKGKRRAAAYHRAPGTEQYHAVRDIRRGGRFTPRTLFWCFGETMSAGRCPCGCDFDPTRWEYWNRPECWDEEIYDHTSRLTVTRLENMHLHYAAGWRHLGRNPYGERDGTWVDGAAPVRARWAALGLYRTSEA